MNLDGIFSNSLLFAGMIAWGMTLLVQVPLH